MSEILTIAAGVVQPKDLLMWLRRRRASARDLADEYDKQGDEYEMAEWSGQAAAFDEVIQHIQFGGAS